MLSHAVYNDWIPQGISRKANPLNGPNSCWTVWSCCPKPLKDQSHACNGKTHSFRKDDDRQPLSTTSLLSDNFQKGHISPIENGPDNSQGIFCLQSSDHSRMLYRGHHKWKLGSFLVCHAFQHFNVVLSDVRKFSFLYLFQFFKISIFNSKQSGVSCELSWLLRRSSALSLRQQFLRQVEQCNH